jgi:hypothetical protein
VHLEDLAVAVLMVVLVGQELVDKEMLAVMLQIQ